MNNTISVSRKCTVYRPCSLPALFLMILVVFILLGPAACAETPAVCFTVTDINGSYWNS